MNKSILLLAPIVNHHSLYENLLKFLLANFNYTTFISRAEIIKEMDDRYIKDERVKVIIDESRVDKLYKKYINLINQHDILITDEYNGPYIRLLNVSFNNEKRIIILHNINRWLKINKKVTNKYFIDWFFRRNFFKQFDAVITIGPNTMEHFSVTNKKKLSFFFPFDEYNTDEKLTRHQMGGNKKIVITIPGTVSENRRNYTDLIKTLHQYYSAHNDSRIIFKFLGKVTENHSHILKGINDINNAFGERITFWRSYIPSEEFKMELQRSDYIMSNINLEIEVRGITEKYGISKESGISFILLKFAKPGIVPGEQLSEKWLKGQQLSFNKYSDLIDILSKIDNGEIKASDIAEGAVENQKKFSDEIIVSKQHLLDYLKS